MLTGSQLGSCGSKPGSMFSLSFAGCLQLQLAKLTVWVFLKALYVLCFKCPCSVCFSNITAGKNKVLFNLYDFFLL